MALAAKPVRYVVSVGTTSKTLDTLVSDAGGSIPSQAKAVRVRAHSNGVYMDIDTATTSDEPINQNSITYTGAPAFWEDIAFITSSGSISMTVEFTELV